MKEQMFEGKNNPLSLRERYRNELAWEGELGEEIEKEIRGILSDPSFDFGDKLEGRIVLLMSKFAKWQAPRNKKIIERVAEKQGEELRIEYERILNEVEGASDNLQNHLREAHNIELDKITPENIEMGLDQSALEDGPTYELLQQLKNALQQQMQFEKERLVVELPEEWSGIKKPVGKVISLTGFTFYADSS